jgi:hypothetical protein
MEPVRMDKALWGVASVAAAAAAAAVPVVAEAARGTAAVVALADAPRADAATGCPPGRGQGRSNRPPSDNHRSKRTQLMKPRRNRR